MIEIGLTSVKGSELTWFLRGGRKILGFSVWIEINLVFVWRHRNWLDVRMGIELAWFQWCRRTWLDFCVRDRIWHGFSVGIESDLFFCAGDPNWLCAGLNYLVLSVMVDLFGFCAGDGRNWLGFWMRAANRLVLAWESRLTCFFSGWSMLTWFLCGDRTWLDVSLGIGIDLFCVWGAKTTWF